MILRRDAGPDLAVHVDGDDTAPPLVLVHGLALSHRSWDWLVPLLSREHRVVRIDLRGHGGSDAAPGGYELAGYVSDLVAVLEQVAGSPAVVVGHSLGGLTAAAVAQQRPDLVDATLLEDPSLGLARPPRGTPAGPVIDVLAATAAAGGRDGTHGSLEEVAAAIGATTTSIGQLARDRYAADALLARAHGWCTVDVAAIEPVLHPPPAHLGPGFDVDGGIPVPTVVLTADPTSAERVTTRGDETRLTAASPALRWQPLTGAGHWVHDTEEHRPVVAAALATLLREVGR